MYSGPMLPPPSPKCCMCIPIRLGSFFICLIWATLSMYFAVLSFQNASPFYSHMSQAAGYIYGVANLVLSLVSVAGMLIIITNVSRYVRTFSHAIFVCVFLVLVDGFVNMILFTTIKDEFQNWCVDRSSSIILQNVNKALNGTVTDNTQQMNLSSDYYNCYNLWEDEMKFAVIAFVLMFLAYCYWALCIYSFSIIRRTYVTDADIRAGGANVPMMSAPGVALPPNAMINTGPGAVGAGPFPPPAGSDRNVIVLNNAKPRSKSTHKRRIDTFSFRESLLGSGGGWSKRNSNLASLLALSASAPTAPTHEEEQQQNQSTAQPMQQLLRQPSQKQRDSLYIPFYNSNKDSQFTIGFQLNPEGHIVDIESNTSQIQQQQQQHSPTSAFVNTALTAMDPENNSNIKRKPVQDDDNITVFY